MDGVLCARTQLRAVVVPSAEDIYVLAIENQSKPDLPPISRENDPAGISFSRYPVKLELHLLSGAKGDASDLISQVVAIGENDEAELIDVMGRKADHIVLGSRWYPFEKGALDEVRKVLRSVGVTGDRLTLRQFLELQKLGKSLPFVQDLSHDAASANNFRLPPGDSPKGVVATLYPYQLDGWRWLSFMHSEGIGGILADEMGLGKTLQIIALLSANKFKKSAASAPALIIATGTLLENWRREIKKFAPSLSLIVHHGSDRTGFPAQLKRVEIVITSYDTAVRDIALLRQISWDIVILDEAQAIKNPSTKRATTVKRLPRRVGFAVTGTPIENRLMDLWSLSDFVLPGFLGERGRFDKIYTNDPDGAALLEPLVSPILLRRRIKDVAKDLPARIDIPQALGLDSIAISAYEALRQDIFAEYGTSATLVALTKLRMFCAHPFLVSGGRGDPSEVSEKYQRLVEILEEIFESQEKVLIFTSYNEMADILTQDLRRRFHIWCDYIDGRVAVPERQSIVDRFGDQIGSAILMLNPRAAGTGLNITAANHVIHYNLEWNPAVEDQASARAYRRGQQLPVTVHRLYYADTVEDVMNDRLIRKRALTDVAVVGTSGADEDYADIVRALRASPLRAA